MATCRQVRDTTGYVTKLREHPKEVNNSWFIINLWESVYYKMVLIKCKNCSISVDMPNKRFKLCSTCSKQRRNERDVVLISKIIRKLFQNIIRNGKRHIRNTQRNITNDIILRIEIKYSLGKPNNIKNDVKLILNIR